MARYLFLFFLLISTVVFSQDVFDVARKGTVSQMDSLYQMNQDTINATNANGFSPLILACYRGNTEVAKYLIDKVKDIDYASQEGSALTASAFKGDKELTQLLLDKGASPDIQSTTGYTALMYATFTQNKEMVELLLQYNADRTIQNNQGQTAFAIAVSLQNKEIINLLKLE